ncbi:MAG: hypothetical protein ACT4PZ_16250 [Panacagrimonas sp.]
MPDLDDLRESPTARRCGQVCVVALAALTTSGAGLLAFLNQPSGPVWLWWVVAVSAVAVAASLTGWLVASAADFTRRLLHRSKARSSNS